MPARWPAVVRGLGVRGAVRPPAPILVAPGPGSAPALAPRVPGSAGPKRRGWWCRRCRRRDFGGSARSRRTPPSPRGQYAMVQSKLMCGRGVRAAKRSRNSCGVKIRWRVPSCHGWRSVQTTRPSARRASPFLRERRAQKVSAESPRYGETILAWPWGEPVKATTLYAAFQRALCRGQHRRLSVARPPPHVREPLRDGRGRPPDREGTPRPPLTRDDDALQPSRPADKAAAVEKLAAALEAPRVAAPAVAAGGSAASVRDATSAPKPPPFRHVSGTFSPGGRPREAKVLTKSTRWKVEAGN